MFDQFKSWPFIEARRLLSSNIHTNKEVLIFETGYGPSGLPHIGTFGEVFRTALVMNAIKILEPQKQLRLLVVSDDLDGLRKVPTNIPNREMMEKYLNQSLSAIPDPYEKESSYAAGMNKRLCDFLNQFDFKYEFISSTENYKSGVYNEYLLKVLKNYDKIMKVMLPSLREERQKTYSPILPICQETGIVLEVPLIDINPEEGTVKYKYNNKEVEQSILNGKAKLQWKPDWGMRWAALNIDYEMCGKDVEPSAVLSSKICRILGNNPPMIYRYELFLDQNGEKISKSKGTGVSIDEWIRYAPIESIKLFMFLKPQTAKKLYFDAIPKVVDEYLRHLMSYKEGDYDNPVWHVHLGNVPVFQYNININFSLLLNLASACNPENRNILIGFLKNYCEAELLENKFFLSLIDYALVYYNDLIKPYKKFHKLNDKEIKVFEDLILELEQSLHVTDNQEFQEIVY
ncbi:MAG: lysine--tRNA ligase, partial [Anaplasmataceae bacterium]|nr:lysine--tRNA ligase [Anaplasmataceae bacterium]